MECEMLHKIQLPFHPTGFGMGFGVAASPRQDIPNSISRKVGYLFQLQIEIRIRARYYKRATVVSEKWS